MPAAIRPEALACAAGSGRAGRRGWGCRAGAGISGLPGSLFAIFAEEAAPIAPDPCWPKTPESGTSAPPQGSAPLAPGPDGALRERPRPWLSRARGLGLRGLRLFLVAAAVAGLLWVVPTPYVLRAPGRAEDVSEMVHIEGRPTYPSPGRFYLTTVIYERASLLHLLYALLRPGAELVPLADSPIRPDPRYQRSMQQQMSESQYNAQVAALTRLGYRIERHPRGVQVLDLLEASPARGQLEPLDLITAVEGQPVLEVRQLQQKVRATPPGQRLRLEVVRGGEKRQVEVTVGLVGGRRALGVQVRTLEEPGSLPVRIHIEPGNINGASAGLIFALEILDQLTPGDLARGHLVAGTGTIEADGTVGPVVGVDMKVRAAEAVGASWFLCPKANAAEARSAARTLQVVTVENLQQALQALASLPPAGGR